MFTSVFGLVLVLILIKFYIFFFIHLNRSECVFPSIFHFVFYTDFFSPLFLYRIFFRSMNRLQGTLKKSKPHTFFGYLQNDQSHLIRNRSSNSMSKQLFRMFFFWQFFKKGKNIYYACFIHM